MKEILVAEDNKRIQVLLKSMLEPQGYRVHCLDNGKETLAFLEDHTPDLAILDLMMPFTTGADVAKHMRTTDRLEHIPIIMLTGLDDPYWKEAVPREHFDSFIQKPFERKALLAEVRDLIATREGSS
ncbi:MAG: response regulator [Trueperaceae bacterium]|nr:response regulator [Trueperaceae bacterium]